MQWTEEPDGLQSICRKESQLKQLSTEHAYSLFDYAYFFIYAVLKKSCYASIYLLFSDLQTYPFVLVSVCSVAESHLTLTPHEL